MILFVTLALMKPVADAPVTDWKFMLGARPDLPPNTAELLAAVLMSITTWLMLPPVAELFVSRKPAGASRQNDPMQPPAGRREHALSSQADSLGREWSKCQGRQGECVECLVHA
jgi:hypothetical protein